MSENRQFLNNPATGARLVPVARHDASTAASAASTARVVQPYWAARTVRERARVFRRAVGYIVDHADELAGIVSECTGKPRVDALSTEVMPGAIMSDYYARNARRFLRPRRLGRSSLLFFNKRSVLRREPFGIVGIISPWNYPLGIPLHEVITGLLCGNAVLLKVATQAQPVGEAIARMLSDCGLPEGLFHLLHLPGRIAGDALLDAGIGKLFFTGSTEVGRELAVKAGQRLVPVSLELGGKDAMIVLADAPIDRAVAGAVWAGLSNAGQSCGAVERLYVVDEIYEEFTAKLADAVSSLSVGPDTGFAFDIGSLTTADQLATVRRQLADALSGGARIVARSKDAGESDGLFHPAVVLADVDPDSSVMRHETFGPILAVERVADESEAVRKANDSDLGLSGSVWTTRRTTGRRIAGRIQAGAVTVNDHLMSHGMPETPWGGYKRSGLGRSHGELGFHEMTQPKAVVEELLPRMRKNMWWHPYDRNVYDALRAGLIAVYGRGPLRRVRSAVRLASLFVARAFGRRG